MSIPREDLPVTERHDVYPAIDPQPHFDNQTYRDKVVLITGSSRGIGQEIALFYAKSGAIVVLVARQQDTLDEVKNAIAKDVPAATIATFVADVKNTKEVQAAVEGAVEKFGKLDIVFANAGKGNEWKKPFTECDPDDWWSTMEVNVRGVYNAAHYSLPHLDKTGGYFIITSSVGAQMRRPFGSAYELSKHTLGRLNEFIKIEHPQVKSMAVHPGGILTKLADLVPEIHKYLVDTLQLPAATMLQLTSGKYDWFSGRFVSANWDLAEVEGKYKEKILAEEALVSRLAIPA
ncbi:NAD-P-binding protein [Sistotremastrum niveocremeum HHB9708]|uniref:NAD-P-binding protein n=2 Tax=Sistotremastraceae TaxID=3402574 RepID=A0A164N769_9AGAM|nr:NAD-P-binding protein [Sistotremastrum niveocremeum HHB9708]KZT38566.1 putative oxidoreductase [Sistotremastrum suecicum HHB10207 ss-3]